MITYLFLELEGQDYKQGGRPKGKDGTGR